jgi:LPXTG-motif cell wall-anchored protein
MHASLSLGEVAVQNRTRNGAQLARSYTNADVQNLITRRGVGNIMEAANRAPSGVPAPAQDTQVATSAPASQQNTSSGSTATSSAQNVGQPAQNSSNTPAEGSPGVGQGADNQAQQNTQSSAGNSGTTPQIRQAQPTDMQENSSQQLPATSTFLPLLGLIGLATSGAGLWYRKSRKNL